MTGVDRRVWTQIAEQFDALVELPQAERERRLIELAAADPALAREVRVLLRADSTADGVLEWSLERIVPELADAAEAPWETAAGSQFGPYRLVEPIGEGGMGEVWRAERVDGAYSQQVALKLLKRGMDTRMILRRFLQERSILARLQHPNIVRIFDGGMSPDGRPWYAMAHVDGEPIIAYAARRRLGIRERVTLMATVAEAVAYAHTQLVVHRDLKPGNILVTADGQPHLLDFGIAKLLQDTGEDTATGTGVRVMSPAYAAPEQILGQAVGTATDVYALGVVAYQLLTGRLPHRRQSGDPALLADQVSRDAATERASHAIGQGSPEHVYEAYGARIDRRRLARQAGGDLDLVLTTALRPEPERRYAGAAAFAADLRAWLDARPIAARPDSAGYRLRRFARRHVLGVAASVLVALSLIVGLAGALWQAGIARAQADRAELVKDFVVSLFQESDPIARAQVQALSPRELVAAGIERASGQLRGDAELRLQILADLGRLAFALGDVELAADTLERVRTERRARERRPSAASAEVASQLAAIGSHLGDLDAAERMASEAIAVLRAQLGESALATAEAEGNLARVLLMRGDLPAALELTRSVHAKFAERLGPDDPETLTRLSLIGIVLEQQTRLDEADAVFADVVAGLERSLGPEHARLVRPLSTRGDVARRQERHAEARPLFERAIAIARLNFGESHPVLGAQLMRYADMLRRMGEFETAAAVLDEAEPCFPATAAESGQIWFYRGQLNRNLGRSEQAVAAFEQAHRIFLSTNGEGFGLTWASLASAAEARMDQERFSEAEPALELVLERMRAIFGDDSYDYAYAAQVLGRLRRSQQRIGEAVDLHGRAVTIMARLYGEDNANTGLLRFELAQSLRAAGELPRARAELDRILANLEPGTSVAQQEAAIRLESARLAQLEGDGERQRSDAAAALRLAGDGEWADESVRAAAAALLSSGRPR